MARGLLWLPLLAAFIWLAWSGWNEYQKLEAYKIWAEDFDNAKFDIYAVLGKKARRVTWGKPTRKGMIELKDFSLDDVKEINLLVGDRPVELDDLPSKGSTAIEFDLVDSESIRVPFTDISLAAKWCAYLQKEWQSIS
ncbi:hypothetical protein IQ255_28775 [Pleurocapsales cyanobacterium LEGE 10410]|nr:hypothetical protein [Pleurocapsales cyanobacterium LEGE 10410]